MCVSSLHRHDEGVSRRGFLKAGAAAALGAAATVAGPVAPVMAARGKRDRIADLTHVFAEGFPMYVGPNPSRNHWPRSRKTASTRNSGPSPSTPVPMSTSLATSSRETDSPTN